MEKQILGYELDVTEDDDDGTSAYLRLPNHPGLIPGVVKKVIRLDEYIAGEVKSGGPEINLDLDANNVVIGIEILIG